MPRVIKNFTNPLIFSFMPQCGHTLSLKSTGAPQFLQGIISNAILIYLPPPSMLSAQARLISLTRHSLDGSAFGPMVWRHLDTL